MMVWKTNTGCMPRPILDMVLIMHVAPLLIASAPPLAHSAPPPQNSWLRACIMEIGRKLSSSYRPIDPYNLRSRVSLSRPLTLVKLSTPLMTLSRDAEGLRPVFTRSLRLGLVVRLGSITISSSGISSVAGLEVVLPYVRGENPERPRHLGPTKCIRPIMMYLLLVPSNIGAAFCDT